MVLPLLVALSVADGEVTVTGWSDGAQPNGEMRQVSPPEDEPHGVISRLCSDLEAGYRLLRWRAMARFGELNGFGTAGSDRGPRGTVEKGVTMRGQISAFLPRQTDRPPSGSVGARDAALRYAACGWPVAPAPGVPPTCDAERVFAAWAWIPQAPVLAACGVAFDVVEADGRVGRAALARLERLGVPVGPITVQRAGRAELTGLFVKAGSAAAIGPLLDPDGDPGGGLRLFGAGAFFELPTLLEPVSRLPPPAIGRAWLRPPTAPRPELPAAHLVLGALAMVARQGDWPGLGSLR
jgi:hypothetical protein